MLHGVVVDSLTKSFLDLALNPVPCGDLHESLRGFFHDARNRLNLIRIGLYLAKRAGTEDQNDLWSELNHNYRGLEVLYDRVQTLIRPGTFEPAAADLGAWLEDRRPTWTSWFEERGRSLLWCPPSQEALGWFDPNRFLHGLDALLSWRSSVAGPGQPSRLSWSASKTEFEVEWFEENAPLSEPLEGKDGRPISMAIPLLARLMASHSGTVSVENYGGFIVRLAWPIRQLLPASS